MSSDVSILVGYDGSDDALAALNFAAAEALAREASLHLVYAVDDTVLNSAWGIVFDVEAVRRGGLDLLESAREIAHSRGVPLDRIVTDCLVGQPAAVLSRLSESSSIAVVGRRTESGLESMFVGSTAVGLAGTASCPIIVASELHQPELTKGVIGVGLDPGAKDPVAVEWGLKRARRLGAPVEVLSVVKRPTSRFFAGGEPDQDAKDRAVADVRQRVEAAVAGVRAQVPEVEVTVTIGYGSPVDELTTLSEKVDMLILGVRPSFPMYSVGGIVRALMAHASCTLGIIRHA